MQHKLASKIVVLSVLFALIFSAVGSAPTQAAGIGTHTNVISWAIAKLKEFDSQNTDKDYSELVTLLETQRSVVNYGAMFPDWGMIKALTTPGATEEVMKDYREMSEVAHDTCYYLYNVYHPLNKMPLKFRETLTTNVGPIFKENHQAAAVAFLFGVISHQEADFRWHFTGFETWAGSNLVLNTIEWDVDMYLLNFDQPSPLLYIGTQGDQAILDAYALVDYCNANNGVISDVHAHPINTGQLDSAENNLALYYSFVLLPAADLIGGGTPLSLSTLQAVWNAQHCNWVWVWDWFKSGLVCTNWITPHQLLMGYPEGGIEDMASKTAEAWMRTWDLLNNTNPSIASITPSPAQPDGNKNWYRQPVTLTLEATDSSGNTDTALTIYYSHDGGQSYLEYDGPFTISTDGNYHILAYSVDSLGIAGTIQSLDLKIDQKSPFIKGATTTTPNGNGWYNTDVTIKFAAEDEVAGLETIDPDLILASEGAGQSITGMAVDQAGNSASVTVGPINIDKTLPVVNVSVDKPRYTKTEKFIIHFSGSDALSGLSSLTAEFNGQPVTDGQAIDLFWFPLGTHTLTVRAEDLAGNITEVSQSIEVTATLEGLKDTLDRLCKDGELIKSGTCNDLSAKLNAARAAHDRGNDKTAMNILNAFQNAVKAQAGKAITQRASQLLLLDSAYVIENLLP